MFKLFNLIFLCWTTQASPANCDTTWTSLCEESGAAGSPLDSNVIPFILNLVVPTLLSLQPTQLIRYAQTNTMGWFDAIAPYHPTAVGVISDIPRRPPAERTTQNINTALAYANWRVFPYMMPETREPMLEAMVALGLDPEDNSLDLTTPIGIGNYAAASVIKYRDHDGMNQLGNLLDVEYNRQRYSDYTNYQPKNPVDQILYPSRWQPALINDNNGVFNIQVHLTPQLSRVKGLALKSYEHYQSPTPKRSNYIDNYKGYKKQADIVIGRMVQMTDLDKLLTEHFDDKIQALSGMLIFFLIDRELDVVQLVHLEFLRHVALFEASRVVWNQKLKYDAVRPFTAIHQLYDDDRIPGLDVGSGKRVLLKGNEWTSYLPVGPWSEYPSASSCFCSAQAQAFRRYFDGDTFGQEVIFSQGSSRYEPGVTPHSEVSRTWPTITEWEQECAASRVNAGVHFPAAAAEGLRLCKPLGDVAFKFYQQHLHPRSHRRRHHSNNGNAHHSNNGNAHYSSSSSSSSNRH